jgi:PAS domain S-box-containing protein
VEDPLHVFQIGGLIIVGLLTGLTFLSVNRQAQLAQAVDERTLEIARVNEQLQEDIAERVQAEAALSEREAQYRSIFESTSDGLLIFDLNGELVDLNPATARMHGYTAEEFRELSTEQFIHAESLPLFERFIKLVNSGSDFRGQAMDLRRDGTPFHIEVMGTGFTYRGRPHALAVIRDITEEVEAYQLLEQRVDERTRELTTLLAVSASIASTLNLQPLLDLILEQLQQVVACDGVSIMLLEGDELHAVAHRGPISEEALPQIHFSQEQARLLLKALRGRASLVIDNVRGDTLLAQAFQQALGEHLAQEMSYVHTWVGVALTVQDRLIGWLGLHYSQPEGHTDHHTALAQSIASQAAIAVENARLYGQAWRLAALEERQRLARELHDSVSQALYGIGLGTRTARTQLDRVDIATEPKRTVAEPLDYVLSLAESSLTEMRALIFELRPESLEKEGLVAALTRQTAALRARQGLDVHTDFCEEPELSFEVKEALYRVAQEGLYNAARHAQASRVTVNLKMSDEGLLLEVEDDGVGFDAQREYPGHMGLHSMRERVAQLGGALVIDSAPGQGTRLQASIPLIYLT